MELTEIPGLVIGAGAVGLACGYYLAPQGFWVIEAEAKFGQGSSSRNSEVIHSGIYYPENSLKKTFCLAGREKLYRFCERAKVPVRRSGKLIVAWEAEEEESLRSLQRNARNRGIATEWLTRDQVKKEESQLNVRCALKVRDTGILDSHSYLSALEGMIAGRGGSLVYRHRVVRVEKVSKGWEVALHGPSGEIWVRTSRIVNAAGLSACEIRRLAFPDSIYSHSFCRGRYFLLSSRFKDRVSTLVYPPPEKHGLGVHLTMDMGGNLRLGPDVDWLTEANAEQLSPFLDCDWDSLAPAFTAAAARYFSDVKGTDLSPGYIGIRPKLYSNGKPTGDFAIAVNSGWVDCLGIESPGLTCSLEIGEEVAKQFSRV